MKNFIKNTVYTARQKWLRTFTGTTRDYNYECGYPDYPSIEQYKEFYDRWGVAQRVVQLWPKECWQVTPSIYENEKEIVEPFEQAVLDLDKKRNLFSFMFRADVLSGIGRYGVMLLGWGDGKKLHQPMTKGEYELLYFRVFDESVLAIASTENDPTNSRYGLPIQYTISSTNVDGTKQIQIPIHYSRVVHLADNRESEEAFGAPRLKPVYNNIHDARKVGGGAGEMFWKGGFPGIAYTLDPKLDLDNTTIDTDTLKDEVEKYQNGLQRYQILAGMQANSMAPAVADPRGTFEVILKQITIAMGVPMRVFLGTEAAKLASAQDNRTWQGRVKQRQELYLTPLLIRPIIDELIKYGALPKPTEYSVKWPDTEQPAEGDQVKIANERSKSIATYFSSGAYKVIAPKQYFKMVHGFTDTQIDAITAGAKEFKATADTFDKSNNPDNLDNKQRFEKKRGRLTDAKKEP